MPQLTISPIWYPFITYWLTTYCQVGQTLSIAIAPGGGYINVLLVCLVWEKRAIPLFWSLLPKLVRSNVTEQRDAIAEILPLLKDYKVVVIGNR